jgi:simple sugar transport system ATP-binding protein
MPAIKKRTKQSPLLSMRGISKSFQNVRANDQIDLDVYSGEIHALLGENGAGKSTLVKILFGFYRADAGEIRINDKVVSIQAPRDALAVQIGMVFQDLNLIPAFTVAENIALFLPQLPAILNPSEINRKVIEVSKQTGLKIDPKAQVSNLSIGEQQRVEILKLLLSNARVLILDEPTRVLAPHELRTLFEVLSKLRDKGYAIILITHKMNEVLEVADRITVLRAGRIAGTFLRGEATESKLVRLMFGKRIAKVKKMTSKFSQNAPPLLALQGIHTRTEGGGMNLKGINVTLRPGEILGVAGVSGNGQRELCDLVLGMERATQGKKFIFGRDLTNQTVTRVRSTGVGFIPENPLSMASVPWMTVLENLTLTNTERYSRMNGFAMDLSAAKKDASETAKRLGFPVNYYAVAKSLSGGNLQRMVIVREMMHNPRLIVASYLTRGLDVQSAVAARRALLQARNDGAGVLLISEDLDELFDLTDRLLVLFEGKIVGDFKPSETDIYEVGYLMTGSRAKHAKRQ